MNNIEVTQKVIFEKLYKPDQTHEKGKTQEGQDFSVSECELDKAYFFLNKLIENQGITSARPVLTKRKGLFGKAIVFVKKIIRKAVFWYIEPICESQTKYNEMCTQFAIQMFYYAQRMDKQKSEVLQRIKEEEVEKQRLNELFQILSSQTQSLIQKYDEQQRGIEILSHKVSDIKDRGDEFVYISEATKNVIEDMQIIRRENEELFKPNVEDFWNKITVAQSGEDSIIAYVLMVLGINLKDEYYLDLGANHAKQLSNTYMLYKKGMRGVLLEANPQLIGELKFYRGEDVILNKCIADKTGMQIPFYILSGDGLSSMSLESVHEVMRKNPRICIEEQINIETITINDILDKYFEKAPLVLNIDIEGMEEEILRAIDYDRYTPFIIVVERIDYGMSIAINKKEDGITDLMNEKGYFEYAFTGINSIFINKKKLEEIRDESSF